MNIIANLTAKQKAVIRRDFLIDNFKGAYGNNAAATSCSILPVSTCPTRSPKLKVDIMRCMRNAINVSRNAKPPCWQRNGRQSPKKPPRQKIHNPRQRYNPKNIRNPKRSQLDHNSIVGRRNPSYCLTNQKR